MLAVMERHEFFGLKIPNFYVNATTQTNFDKAKAYHTTTFTKSNNYAILVARTCALWHCKHNH